MQPATILETRLLFILHICASIPQVYPVLIESIDTVLVQLWANDQLHAQLRYIIRFLLL